MLKTPKVKLMKYLEDKVIPDNLTNVQVTIVDALFYLHLQSNLPQTFGQLSQYLFRGLCALEGDEIHMVFDKTISPSIKDSERDARAGCRSREFEITGKSQKRPDEWLKSLRNDSFKNSLVEFLVQSWNDDSLVEILGNKIIFANHGDKVYSYKALNNQMIVREEVDYYSRHEEADTRMIFHLTKLQPALNVVIRTADTDVLLIALGCFEHINYINLWLEVGLYTRNTLRFINVNQLHNKLGNKLAKALPAYHAFTGCDYTAAFSRKGKIAPLKILEKDEELQEIFGCMGGSTIDDDVYNKLEAYTCQIYGHKKSFKINEV
jgi:hypothetical protein